MKTITNVGSYFHQEEAMPEQLASETLFSHFQNTLPQGNPGGATFCAQHTEETQKVWMELRIQFVSE